MNLPLAIHSRPLDSQTAKITPLPKRTGAVLFLLLAAAFLILNRQAYQGYFSDDDINSMAWTRWAPALEYLKGTVMPTVAYSYRAVGFYFYHLIEHLCGLDFPKYVAAIQALHLVSVWLLWLLMRRLGTAPVPAGAACLFFALHAASFGVVWQPMYVFDLLCGGFSIASILLWVRGNWILSFVAFWLAYKSKEIAVMLPFVLAAYELYFGGRRWLRLVPFVAASGWFTVQSLLFNPQPGDYSFHFTWAALTQTAPFYAWNLFLDPYLIILLPIGAIAVRNRRVWFGLSAMALFFFPLLWLPGRVFAAYSYLPLTGLALALAGTVEDAHPAALTLVLLLWLPHDIHWINRQRRETLRMDRDARVWVGTLRQFSISHPAVGGFVYEGVPKGIHSWGPEGAVKYFYPKFTATVPAVQSPEGADILRHGNAAVLDWRATEHRLVIEIR
jgi:hypothetical protein